MYYNPKHGQGAKAQVVNFHTAARDGEPFEAMIAKHGIPNQVFPHCSRELKARTIDAYMREIGFDYDYKAIGILVREGFTITDRNIFWRSMPFRLNLKGFEDNCGVCWKKTLRKLLTIAKYHPERFDRVRRWEKKYEFFVPETQAEGRITPIRFYRENLTVDDIIEMSKQPFEDAKDDRMIFTVHGKQLEFELDLASGCVESCEPPI